VYKTNNHHYHRTPHPDDKWDSRCRHLRLESQVFFIYYRDLNASHLQNGHLGSSTHPITAKEAIATAIATALAVAAPMQVFFIIICFLFFTNNYIDYPYGHTTSNRDDLHHHTSRHVAMSTIQRRRVNFVYGRCMEITWRRHPTLKDGWWQQRMSGDTQDTSFDVSWCLGMFLFYVFKLLMYFRLDTSMCPTTYKCHPPITSTHPKSRALTPNVERRAVTTTSERWHPGHTLCFFLVFNLFYITNYIIII
jgi:hypothetical protein